MIPLIWFVLTRINPPELKKIPGGRDIIEEQLRLLGKLTPGERWTAVIFFFTAFCWIFSAFIKKFFKPCIFSDATIAMIGGILLFLIPIDLKRAYFY